MAFCKVSNDYLRKHHALLFGHRLERRANDGGVMRSNQVLLRVIGADDEQVGRAVATQHAWHDDISSVELISI